MGNLTIAENRVDDYVWGKNLSGKGDLDQAREEGVLKKIDFFFS